MSEKEIYYNFPVQLLKGFMMDHSQCLLDVLHYVIYEYTLTLTGDRSQKITEAERHYGVSLKSGKTNAWENGAKLYSDYPGFNPITGISRTLFWSYYGQEKTDYEKVVLLAFLALKSIIGNKSHMKLDNKYWFSRMAGNTHSVPIEFIYPSLSKYAKEYWCRKIKSELSENWGLVTYSIKIRGFYVSFKMNLKALIMEAEKKRQSNKEKQKRTERDKLLKEVLLELGIKERP